MSNEKTTAEAPTPITEVPETPDDGIRGELAQPEIAQLQQLQAQANACYNRIGQLEVQKATILGRIGAIEGMGKQVMDGIAERCGIPVGVSWQITPDNKVQVLSNVVPFTQGKDQE